MLLNLHIKNYALIEDLRLEFAPGLNVFTGETGAGKSIIIESIGLVLGERASSQGVRKGAEHAFVTAEFDAGSLKELAAYLKEQALYEGDVLIVRREIDSGGKSRAFVNDRPVSLATLAAVGQFLVDIHGQHEHQSLIHPASQRRLLDRYGDLEALLSEVEANFHAWRQVEARRQSQQISEQERQRLIDVYTFQRDEIDGAKLYPGEEEEIKQALPQLKNAGKLNELSNDAYQLLYGADGAVLDSLNKVHKLLETITILGGALRETGENLNSACYQLEEVARDIESFREGLNADPEKLNETLSRHDLLLRLKKKYGQTVADILAFRDRIAADLDALLKSDRNRQEIEARAEQQLERLNGLCEKLSNARTKAAQKLASGVQKELAQLGMGKACFNIALEKEPAATSQGYDRISFLFSANPGESIQPLKDIASGGEMSRVMLALKTVLAKADRTPALIFDEIDAGIGGPMGQTVGRKLKNLSSHHQILCITHLPQIAAGGDHHLAVAKENKAGRTLTKVRSLSEKEHLEEVARMLSGEEITPSARKHAAELVESSRRNNA